MSVQAAQPTAEFTPDAVTRVEAAPARTRPVQPSAGRVAVMRPGLPTATHLDSGPVPWQLQARAVRPRGPHRVDLKALRERQADWLLLSGAADTGTRAALRARLVSQGPVEDLRDEALACVAAKAHRVLGRDPSDAQLHCAQGLLDGSLVEMADGEGKSLAVALAAAAFALSGEPVHVFTANDFLAARDARQHAAFFVALGLRVGIVTGRSTPPQRQAAYAADIVYSTAQSLAQDHLRDRQQALMLDAGRDGRDPASGTESPLFPRGLCCALVDDAYKVLLEEATTPLDLVEVHDDPDLHAACIVALALARRVRLDVDVVLDVSDCSVDWTDVGLARLHLLSAPLGEGWLDRTDRHDLLSQALVALHGLHAEHDYLLRNGRVELLAPVQAPGSERQEWPRTLQTLVEIKEGCRPSPMLRTVARTRLQRFFPLYKHLAGTGAALREDQKELQALYRLRPMHLAPQRPQRLEELPQQVFEASCLREAAAVQRIKSLLDDKRSVLVGVAQADAAAALDSALRAAGIECQMADGRDDALDAQSLERAGQPGTVTVMTPWAGCGVVIPPSPELTAVGGLHVLDLLDTPCARTRQQFLARALHADAPCSAETWHAADMPCWDSSWIDLPARGSPQWMVDAACRLQHLMQRWTQRRERRRLLA